MKRIDGKPIEPGVTVTTDHVEQEYRIKLRSLTGIGTTDLKDFLQKRYEVCDIEQTARTTYVR